MRKRNIYLLQLLGLLFCFGIEFVFQDFGLPLVLLLVAPLFVILFAIQCHSILHSALDGLLMQAIPSLGYFLSGAKWDQSIVLAVIFYSIVTAVLGMLVAWASTRMVWIKKGLSSLHIKRILPYGVLSLLFTTLLVVLRGAFEPAIVLVEFALSWAAIWLILSPKYSNEKALHEQE